MREQEETEKAKHFKPMEALRQQLATPIIEPHEGPGGPDLHGARNNIWPFAVEASQGIPATAQLERHAGSTLVRWGQGHTEGEGGRRGSGSGL